MGSYCYISFKKQGYSSTNINYLPYQSLFCVFCPPFFRRTNQLNRNRKPTENNVLAMRERIPLNLSKLVENPNYIAEKDQLLISGMHIHLLLIYSLY